MYVCGLFEIDEIDNILLLTCIIIFKVQMSKNI